MVSIPLADLPCTLTQYREAHRVLATANADASYVIVRGALKNVPANGHPYKSFPVTQRACVTATCPRERAGFCLFDARVDAFPRVKKSAPARARYSDRVPIPRHWGLCNAGPEGPVGPGHAHPGRSAVVRHVPSTTHDTALGSSTPEIRVLLHDLPVCPRLLVAEAVSLPGLGLDQVVLYLQKARIEGAQYRANKWGGVGDGAAEGLTLTDVRFCTCAVCRSGDAIVATALCLVCGSARPHSDIPNGPKTSVAVAVELKTHQNVSARCTCARMALFWPFLLPVGFAWGAAPRIPYLWLHGFTARVSCPFACRPHYRGGGEFSTGTFLPGKIPPGKNSATLFHGEGQGLRSALQRPTYRKHSVS